MLRSTAGSRLYIGAEPSLTETFNPYPHAVYGGVTWVEIKRLEAMGSLGLAWDTKDYTAMTDGDAPVMTTIKDTLRGQVMQIVMGIEDADPGQLLLLDAFHDTASYHFRLTFGDEAGDPSREWTALVTTFNEQLDNASSVMKRVADLHVTSAIINTTGA
ncbi:hypothetical protein CNY89_05405 [Amaricoccus sp. HAR-UPW-R2A-40]|nr:hypothetical protein CNY89_05405 [Amaricoccus sp. HAR-UPW-R2A-40]